MLQIKSAVVIRVSKLISNFFNPLTSLLLYFIYQSSRSFTFRETFFIFLPILLITIIPISVWIFWNVRKGRYTNMDVSNRNQRKSLYFFIAAALLAFLLYNYFVNAEIDKVMVFVLILLLVMQVSNYFIKSSMHTAFNIFVAALFFVLNIPLGVFWFGIGLSVGVTRIILKRHTPQEVLAGTVIGALISFLYIYTNLQTTY